MFKKKKNNVHGYLLPITDPDSPLLENYRRLYQKISYFHKDKSIKTIGITSASVGEGKTLTSINLALTIAEDTRNQVALLDCDFRRPKIASYLGLSSRNGLAEVIQGKADLKQVMSLVDKEKQNLKVFPLGNMERVSDREVYSFLYDRKMGPILESLKTDFDYIIVDTPPILPIVDINYLAELFDGVLMVIRAGKTSRDLIQAALETLDNDNIIGVVFNGTRRQWSSRYKYEYYSYHPYSKNGSKKTAPPSQAK